MKLLIILKFSKDVGLYSFECNLKKCSFNVKRGKNLYFLLLTDISISILVIIVGSFRKAF